MGSSIEGPSSGDGYGRSKVQVERSWDGAFAFGGFWNHRAHPREGGAEAGGIFMKSTKIELFAVSGADANVHRQ